MGPCYIVDLDGTVADNTHRVHHILSMTPDWKAFEQNVVEDAPIKPMVDLVSALRHRHAVIYITGRSEGCRLDTERWLVNNGLGYGLPLYMRPIGDHRPAPLMKDALLQKAIADGWRPILALEDEPETVQMWLSRGIPCLHFTGPK